MTAWLLLSQTGNKYAAAAEDKTFTVVLRQSLVLRLLPAYGFIDPLCYAKRSHSGLQIPVSTFLKNVLLGI